MSDHHISDQRLSTSQSPFSSLPQGSPAATSANNSQNTSATNSNPNGQESSQSHLHMQPQQQYNEGKHSEFIPHASESMTGENSLSNYRHELNSRGSIKGMIDNIIFFFFF